MKKVLITEFIFALVFIGVLAYLGHHYDVHTASDCPNKAVESCERRKAVDKANETIETQIWRVTAYCPCEKCCGEWSDGITASGAKAKGKLIAAPKSIPFGTWIEIEGYGYAEVLDRGGAIKGRRLDVFFPTHQEALNWGVQYIEVEL